MDPICCPHCSLALGGRVAFNIEDGGWRGALSHDPQPGGETIQNVRTPEIKPTVLAVNGRGDGRQWPWHWPPMAMALAANGRGIGGSIGGGIGGQLRQLPRPSTDTTMAIENNWWPVPSEPEFVTSL